MYAAPHGVAFHLPSGQDVKPAAFAFTAPDSLGRDAFITVANAEIWHEAFPGDPPAAATEFLRRVAAHELVHTQQFPLLQRLNELSAALPDIGDLSDEMFQERFKNDTGYVAAIARQKAALIEALHEPDRTPRLRMARAIVQAYRMRQSRWFGARADIMRTLDDGFVTLEGVAVWFSFQIEPPEGANGSAKSIADYYEIQTSGSWVQMHGALFAALLDTIDRRWRLDVFGPGWTSLPAELELLSRG
jgi:hypothetical protein